VIYLVLVAGGVVLGLIAGRWWTLAAAVAVGIWITATAIAAARMNTAEVAGQRVGCPQR
jgi:hypothetical protein